MLKQFKTLMKEDRGTITSDWISLAGGVLTLTLVLIASVQQDVNAQIAGIQPLFGVAPSYN
jgi:hypothetical protein